MVIMMILFELVLNLEYKNTQRSKTKQTKQNTINKKGKQAINEQVKEMRAKKIGSKNYL